MISTNRTLPVQRFTGAHELCHVIMHHSISLDTDEILARELAGASEEIEVQANSFAAEFLLPRWLFVHHAKRQGWNAENMKDPQSVYQMSLRVGASYTATVWALEKHKIIDSTASAKLLAIPRRTIKQQLLPGYTPEHWYRDVWLITDRDKGTYIEGQPEDLFRFQLNEKSGAGYLWDFETLKKNGFVILSDERSYGEFVEVGGDVLRVLTAHSPTEQKGELHLELRRPWQADTGALEDLQLQYNLLGKEKGLPRAKRAELAKAA
jgi:Zn-dependent peptidase ImmA (M78 family)